MKKTIGVCLCAMFFCAPVFAGQSSVGFSSSAVWRSDGKGDYAFKGNGDAQTCVINTAGEVESAVTGSFEPSNSVAADAPVESITASWDYTGDVRLALSADGGYTYARAVNGVPLKAGFNPGRQIKWRAELGQESVLRGVRVAYTCKGRKQYTFGSPELSGFNFRKKLQVVNKGPITLGNYPVKVRVSRADYDRKVTKDGVDVYLGGTVGAAFDDIRFTAADGETILGYYVESVSDNAGKPYADIWVNVPEIPVEGVSLYLYYGNAGAESLSSGEAAFAMFDDFTGDEINVKQWTVVKKEGGAYSVSNGVLNLSHAGIRHKKAKAARGVIEYKAKDVKGQQSIAKWTPAAGEEYAGLSTDTALECDWIRLRAEAAMKPAIDDASRTAKEEKVQLPVFINTKIAANGDLTVKSAGLAGKYISAPVALGLAARIFTARVDAQNIGHAGPAMSFDAGTDFLGPVGDGKTYYVSKGDFTAGDTFMWKIELPAFSGDSGSAAAVSLVAADHRPGTITLVSPNGGETLGVDTQYAIKWSADDYDAAYLMKLDYSPDGGKTYEPVSAAVPNTGSYSWQTPLSESARGMIRVSDAADGRVFDVSDKSFRVVQGPGEYLGTGKGSWEAVSNWGAGKEPDLSTDVRLVTDAVIRCDKQIAFKSLTIGDGIGAHTTVLVIRNSINPASGDIIIRKGGSLIQENKLALSIAGNLDVQAGALLTHSNNTNDFSYGIDLGAKNITLAAGGMISCDGKGYAGGQARNPGRGKAVGIYDRQGAGTGGSHGGSGGYSKGTKNRSASYDTLSAPRELGSGGAGGKEGKGGAGGGVIKLTAQNEFSISGAISANGSAGLPGKDGGLSGGGGAGGSIYLIADTFTGSGARITATGGSGNTDGGGGGGGRVYIQGQKGAVRGTINVNGGDGFDKGKAGSIVFK